LIRTIVSRARILIIVVSKLSRELWAEITNTTVYLTNRSPIKIIPAGKTLHELFYGSKFTYKHLRTFECAVYTLDLQVKKAGKMILRSEKYWF
jgi:hypothetical protein